MYFLEKLPAKMFKMMITYIDSMQGESKQRVIKEAQQFLDKEDTIPMDILET
jgi:hypothetical protein